MKALPGFLRGSVIATTPTNKLIEDLQTSDKLVTLSGTGKAVLFVNRFLAYRYTQLVLDTGYMFKAGSSQLVGVKTGFIPVGEITAGEYILTRDGLVKVLQAEPMFFEVMLFEPVVENISPYYLNDVLVR